MVRKAVRKQPGQPASDSTKAPHQPSLVELIGELEQLTEEFEAIVRRYPAEPATEENYPVRFPLHLRWRPRVDEGVPSRAAAEVILWTDRLRARLVTLEQYFSDWQARPEALDRFPLADYPRSFRGYQAVPHAVLTQKLHEHRRLLLVEAMKQRVLLPETLPDLLKQARTRLGWNQLLAADDLGVSVDTYKSWEQGRAFPRGINHSQIQQFLDALPAEKTPRASASEHPD